MEKLTFKVNEYEGPLDLILALLSKHLSEQMHRQPDPLSERPVLAK